MKSPLPLPELFEEDDLSFSFKQRRGINDAYERRRPPKLMHPLNRSVLNASCASVISFRLDDSCTKLSALYNCHKPESYYEQCFEQLTKVGEGSFGEVFKVRSRTDGRLYAVKKSKTFFRSSQSRQLCLEEVRRYEQFSEHENCVKLYHAWEQDDRLYMQMELCRENLEVFARDQQQLSDDRIWSILVDLLLALKSLHDRNLIHLDIKLDNILVTDDGTCKLADFGIVFDLSKGNPRYATEGDSRYMAPELMEGHYTKAADIFSLGIATLELACNLELPANGRMWQRLRSGQPLPDHLARRVSPTLKDIIHSMMNPVPTERPTVDTLLKHPNVQKLLELRRRRRMLLSMKSYVYRKVSSLTWFLVGAVMWLVSCFRLQHRKTVPPDGTERRIGVHHRSKQGTFNGSTLSVGSCSRTGVAFGASRSFQDHSSRLLADDDFDELEDSTMGGGATDQSACTSVGEDMDWDRSTGTALEDDGTDKESVQITPTIGNMMPPTRTPTIANSTPLNHHLLHHQLHYHHLQQSHSGSRHASRVFCSPLRNLWFEDDPDDLSLLNDSHRHQPTDASSSPTDPKRLNDSDNDFRPLGSFPSDLDEAASGANVTDRSFGGAANEQSITSTPNSSLLKTLRTNANGANHSTGAAAASVSAGCDTPLSTGYSSFLIKKKLRFNAEDDSD
uniref:Membrane-associated tyrosine- and threonine-specific cdc2-inhibitory kinase n=1 Tax=Anopheles farauti TaxID=69004 RepID=A0A182Q3F3_9DIPT